MKSEKCLKNYIQLFFTMLKIGTFTFGGGLAMLSLLENEFVTKREWIEKEEFLDMIAISESTPGPIAINSATYIGYKIGGFFGSLIATVGMVLPSFMIIFLISLFFDDLLTIPVVSYAFRGVQVCVIYLIFTAGLKLLGHLEKNLFNILVLVTVVVVMIAFSIFAVNFSAVFYILISGVLGLCLYLVGLLRKRGGTDE